MRSSIRPKMTFGLSGACELFNKLIFDIERLRNPRNLQEPRYAAFDCASDSWHLAEWVISEASDQHHLKLTGQPRGARRGRITFGFIEVNRDRLSKLSYCQQLANTGKHLKVDQPTDEGLATKGAWRIRPPYEAVVHVITPSRVIPALEFFESVATDWRTFLIEEGYQFPPE